jgi:hypothetical protein
MNEKLYGSHFNEITFLPEEATINISNKDLAFLRETGLPKLVESLEWAFDLSQVKRYVGIHSTQDCKEYINEENVNSSEFLYKIGKRIPFGMFVSIQESNGAIYLAEKPIYKDPEVFLEKLVYINLNIECFAKCLNTYEIFFVNNQDVMDDNDLLTEEERYSRLLKLEQDLKNIDTTIVGSAPRRLDYDGFWTYLIEDMYDVFGIDSYQEEPDY